MIVVVKATTTVQGRQPMLARLPHQAVEARLHNGNGITIRYGFLDSLRGLAILGVILTHAGQAAGIDSGGLHGFVVYGARGVQLFFEISAFTLLCTNPSGITDIAGFFLKRLFRIAPAFYAALAVSLLFYGTAPRYFAPDGIHAHQVVLTLLFLHGFLPSSVNAIVPGGWSIACEMTFYLVFPVLIGLASSLRRAIVALVAGTLLSFTFMKMVPPLLPGPAYLTQAMTSYSFVVQAPAFLAGFVVFRLPRLNDIRLARAGAVAALAALLLLSLSGTAASHFFLAIPPFSLLLWSMSSARFVWLDNRLMQFVGRISFSLYLSHFFVMDLIAAVIHPRGVAGLLVVYPATLVVAAMIATITWRYIEQPGIRYGRRLTARLSSQGRSRP